MSMSSGWLMANATVRANDSAAMAVSLLAPVMTTTLPAIPVVVAHERSPDPWAVVSVRRMSIERAVTSSPCNQLDRRADIYLTRIDGPVT